MSATCTTFSARRRTRWLRRISLTVWKLEQRLAPIVVEMTNTGFGFNMDGVTEVNGRDLEARLADGESTGAGLVRPLRA